MNKLRFIAFTIVFLLFGVLILLCVPVLNVPIPRYFRQNNTLKRFFAWDGVDLYQDNFDETSLKQYLHYRRVAVD